VSTKASAENYWSYVPGSCTPIESSVQNDRYTLQIESDGFGNDWLSMIHKGTNIDIIQMYCQLPNKDAGATHPNVMKFTFKDESTTAGNYVQVVLYRLYKPTGQLLQVKTMNSDSWDGAGTGTLFISSNFTHTFDFESYSYFVVATMDRSSSSIVPRFYQVSLDYEIE
jgi:hypothetical protein